MNIYSWIILTAMIGTFTLSAVSDFLNLKALKEELPDEFSGVYKQEDYRKSQAYTRATTKFGLLSSTFDLIVLLAFWFSGSFNTLDTLISRVAEGPIIQGLLYIGALTAGKFILSLPFSIYSTFVIEERFGFNKTTPATFVKDMIKGLILGVTLGGGVVALILAIFQFGGPLSWLYCWGAVSAFTVVVQFIAPTWIMPLFNKFTPLEEGELRVNIMSYARSVKFSLENIFVIDGSKRSSKANAFFTGFGRHKRIALFDTLIANHSTEELVAILAHEIGHYKKGHILKSMLIGIIHMGLIFYLISVFLGNQELFAAFYMEKISVYGGLIFFSLLFSPVELVSGIFMNMLSRANEFQADRFAAKTSGGGGQLIEALKKLSVSNLANLSPHPFYVFLNYSHPPLMERIAALRKIGT